MPLPLLAIAGRLEPPFVLLEDGRGSGTSTLAWGAAERLRREPGTPLSLDELSPGDGWIGAIAYDAGLPPRAARRPAFARVPPLELFRPRNRIVVRADGSADLSGPDARAAWEATPEPRHEPAPLPVPAGRARARSFDQPAFESAVRRVLEYIRAGDTYQVNLSVAERFAFAGAPLGAYRRLRAINPSPWMGYADFGDWQLVSASPELLVEVADGRARARPIAGTRRRTGEEAKDAAMRAELRADAKEAAEHVMLVDLARNDLGRVAEYGSVRVTELGAIAEYSHVMHLESDVTARLAAGATAFDAFRALFPGGTITGVPKIRAMEIIAELEPCARGMYTGALGWWERDAGQWNILIRTAVVKGGEVVIQAGAGIVADSDPAREWKEALRKAAALRVAFGVEAGDG